MSGGTVIEGAEEIKKFIVDAEDVTNAPGDRTSRDETAPTPTERATPREQRVDQPTPTKDFSCPPIESPPIEIRQLCILGVGRRSSRRSGRYSSPQRADKTKSASSFVSWSPECSKFRCQNVQTFAFAIRHSARSGDRASMVELFGVATR